ncbi:App1 family protein [Flavitalea flava]
MPRQLSMSTSSKYDKATVKIYPGYGHSHNLLIYGHVFAHKGVSRDKYTNNPLSNMIHLIRLFLIKPLSGVNIQLAWNNQLLTATTEKDGFFKFEWKSDVEMPAGWHPVIINLMDGEKSAARSEGKVFIPHVAQYAFISDIDDTVLISHSSTIRKRLRVLFTNNPHTRKAFTDAVRHYRLLAMGHATPGVPNPFFYVSGSEWNLYDDLHEFFIHNKLPEGVFLLNQLKRWFQLFRTGKTNHEGKLLRIVRILEAFPKQQFVLLGDNSQHDPAIYASILGKYPDRIFAVYIRNVYARKETDSREQLTEMEKMGVHTCFYKDAGEAIRHSLQIGLIAGISYE